MISKVTLLELYKDTFRRSTLIAIPHMSELLEVPDSEFTKWEIFAQIVKDSLYKFEYYYPLGRQQKIYIEVDSNSREGKVGSNFEAYLKGIITEDDLALEMSSVQGLSYSAYVGSTYPLRNFRYDNGQFYDFWYQTGVYYANCLCKRPLFEEYENNGEHKPTEMCAVYFLKSGLDNQYTVFRDQVYVEVCRYIMNIRKNMMLANMPIELFQGLEEDFNRVDGQLQNTYQQALRSSYWVI